MQLADDQEATEEKEQPYTDFPEFEVGNAAFVKNEYQRDSDCTQAIEAPVVRCVFNHGFLASSESSYTNSRDPHATASTPRAPPARRTPPHEWTTRYQDCRRLIAGRP